MNALSSELLPVLKPVPQKNFNCLSPATVNEIIRICSQCDEKRDNLTESNCHASVHCRLVNHDFDGNLFCANCKAQC